jgi:hypothetical protein
MDLETTPEEDFKRCSTCGQAHRETTNTCSVCKAKLKQRYRSLKEQGICTKCGSEPIDQGRSRCKSCLERDRRYKRRPDGEQDQGPNLCVICQLRPAKGGTEYCAECFSEGWRTKDLRQRMESHKHPNLLRMARATTTVGSHTFEEEQAILKAQDYRCCYCNADLKALPRNATTIDHIVPLALTGRRRIAGTHYAWNIVKSCDNCNSLKGCQSSDWFLDKLVDNSVLTVKQAIEKKRMIKFNLRTHTHALLNEDYKKIKPRGGRYYRRKRRWE